MRSILIKNPNLNAKLKGMYRKRITKEDIDELIKQNSVKNVVLLLKSKSDIFKNADENIDRLILSKGHCAPALYSALANKGYFDKEELKKLRKFDSFLQGHPDMKNISGVDMTTGSLGQGLSAANGIAIAGKLDNKDYRVYCIVGDGEIEEGQ